MLTGKIRNDIDKLWEKFWTGGITNPLTVIEQISYLMFARMLDMQEDVAERSQLHRQGLSTACSRRRRKASCCAGRTSAT